MAAAGSGTEAVEGSGVATDLAATDSAARGWEARD